MKVIPEKRRMHTKFDIYLFIIDIICLSTTNDNYAHKPLYNSVFFPEDKLH